MAGIGNPDRFFRLLEQSGIKVIEHAFPDHHAFSENDFTHMNRDFPILMTEKDAVKYLPGPVPDSWYVPVTVKMPVEAQNAVMERIEEIMQHGAAGG